MKRLCLFVCGLLAFLPSALPKPAYFDAFTTVYPFVLGTRLGTCAVCHNGNHPDTSSADTPRNPYGLTFADQPHAFDLPNVNQTSIRAIEKVDSDGDGASNIDEINHGTFPGNAADTYDAIPPSITIAAPSAGTTYTTAQTVSIQANASDNVGVTRVDFLDNGTLRGSVSTPPYNFAWTFTEAQNGSHVWTARAFDASTNSKDASVTLTVSIDKLPPTVSITAPADGTTFTSPQTVNIQANASDNVGVTHVDFFDNGNPSGSVSSAPYSAAWPITAAQNGTHTWIARAFDAAGNSTDATINLIVFIDNTPPVVNITAPLGGTTYNTAQTVTIQANATDNIAVTHVDFLDNGTVSGSVSSAPFNFAWTFTDAQNGPHLWTVRAFDAAGNSADATVNLMVAIDKTPPVVSLIAPPPGTTYTNAQTVAIQADASDNIGVAHVDFFDNGTASGSVTNAPYSLSWTFTDAQNGAHLWTARAFDAAGNSTDASVTLTVLIDKTPPVVSIIAPATNTTYTNAETVAIQADASDNIGVARVDFFDNGTPTGSVTSAPYSLSWTFTDAQNGTHLWTARAFDAAGNSTDASVTLTVLIDKTPPVVSITAPADNTTYTNAQTVTIQVNATDNIGVARVDFLDNSTPSGSVSSAPYTFSWTFTGAQNGVHLWTARAFDAAGNSTDATVNLTVAIDKTPPAVSITSPANNTTYTNAQSVTIQASASDNVGVSRVDFLDNGTVRGSVSSAPFQYAWSFTASDNKAHVWTARAFDAAGNSTDASVNLIVNIDNVSPVVTVTAPADNTRFTTAQTVTIQVSATDNVGVTHVDFLDNGALRGTISSLPFNFNWSFTGADNGTHVWTARAYDPTGNATDASVHLEVAIGVSPPAISITAPADGTTYVTAQTVSIRAAATDNVGVTHVDFLDNGALRGTISSAPYDFTWSFTGADDGTHVWTARAFDTDLNSTDATVSLTVNIDTTPPSVSIAAPANNSIYTSAQTVTIEVTATDNIGVTKVEFSDNGVVRSSVTSPPYAYNWVLTKTENGAHTWAARAYDAAGNSSTSSITNLQVNITDVPTDSTPPNVVITTPTDGSAFQVGQTVPIQATATDNVGVASVDFYDNGTLNATIANPPFSLSWSLTSADVGAHTWTAAAHDAAGNTSTATVHLTVSTFTTVPQLSISRSGNTYSLSWFASDDGYRVQQCTALGASAQWTAVPMAPPVADAINRISLAVSVSSLRLVAAPGQLTLQWNGDGKLQHAPTLSGPWEDISGAASPQPIQPSGGLGYYRLRPVGQVFFRLYKP